MGRVAGEGPGAVGCSVDSMAWLSKGPLLLSSPLLRSNPLPLELGRKEDEGCAGGATPTSSDVELGIL